MDSAVPLIPHRQPAILCVCVANICRSPALEAYLRKLLPKAHVDSAGVSASFYGASADRRMVQAARARGIEIAHTARPLEEADYHIFDYIVAATREVKEELEMRKPLGSASQILYYSEIDDPYGGGEEGFEKVLTQIAETAKWVVDTIGKTQ